MRDTDWIERWKICKAHRNYLQMDIFVPLTIVHIMRFFMRLEQHLR